MLPAGDVTDDMVRQFTELADEGDIIVDGANSYFRDSVARAREVRNEGLRWLDAGVSGGVWGYDVGYCTMIGGDPDAFEHVEPAFETLAPANGYAYLGDAGAGHFAKMVHNGVEYALMQAYAEGYELMAASELDIDCPGVMETWRHGSVVRSWLLDLLATSLVADPDLSEIRGYAEDSGEGRWTVNEGVRLAVPLPVITAALFARFASRQDDSPAMKVIASLRNAFGGHVVAKSGVAVAPEDITGAGSAPAESRPG